MASVVVRVLGLLRKNKTVTVAAWTISAYILATFVFWFYRTQFSPGFSLGYITYSLGWLELGSGEMRWLLLMLSILAASLCGCLFDYLLVASISKIPVAFIKSILTIACTAYGCVISVMVAQDLIRQDFGYGALFVGAAATLVPVVVASITLALVFLRVAVASARRVGMSVFDAASSPTVSPFTYFTSLLSVSILLMKFIQEVVK